MEGEALPSNSFMSKSDRTHSGFFVSCLSISSQQALQDIGTYVDLRKGQMIFGPDLPPDYVYFLDEGVAAISARTYDEKLTGCALIGPEGYLLPASILGVDRVANQCQMMTFGRGLRVHRDELFVLQQNDASLQKLLLQFVYIMIAQMIATSHANSVDPVSKRLVRLFLMIFDRSGAAEIQLSHEDCAAILGVRRPSVTNAMHLLEGEQLIKNSRGSIQIINRAAMRNAAGKSYGGAEKEYNRIIGKYF